MGQLDLFGASAAPASTTPAPEAIRRRLAAILDLLREAEELPWTAAECRTWRMLVPQMSNWLPEDERQAVCAEFATHLERLQAKAA